MQRTRDITISVIIPVYNVERYLQKCLESIALQSFGDFEAIVVDDGSTDGSGAIADEFSLKDNRFKVIHKENGGLASARNVGLDAATGKYIAFLDGDDWAHPQLYEFLLSELIKSSAKIAMSNFTKVYNSYINNPKFDTDSVPKVTDGYTAVKSLIEYTNPSYIVVWNKLYDRDLIGASRFMDIVSEDMAFNMELYMKASIVSYLPLPLIYYRQREKSITHNANEAYQIDKIATAFHGFNTSLRNNDNLLESIFLWRWFKYALNRLNAAQGTIHEFYANQMVSSLMDEYLTDIKRLLPWHKRKLLMTMWKHKRLNNIVISLHKWLKQNRSGSVKVSS